MRACLMCGNPDTREEIVEQEFPYGVDGPLQVTLRATVPVVICDRCGFGYTDERGERARMDAVSDHLLEEYRLDILSADKD